MKYLIIILVGVAFSAPLSDLVDLTKISQLPQDYHHKWYSGYLKTQDEKQQIYYSFWESQSNPAKDPVILWLQGGPGCSGLFGQLYENGPLMFKPSSLETFINPYAWNVEANLLYIESPPGVGFSTNEFKTSDDIATTNANLQALEYFFGVLFPELSTNEFYISGESYAGIYIPYLATAIINFNKASLKKINLKGFLLGNGCTLGEECTDMTAMIEGYSKYEFQQLNHHAFVSPRDWELYEKYCSGKSITKKCKKAGVHILKNLNDDYYDLNNLNGECFHVPPEYEKYAVAQQNSYKRGKFRHLKHKHHHHHHHHHHKHHIGECDFELGDFYLLNNQTVREALHVPFTVKDKFWETCAPDSQLFYNSMPDGSFYLYKDLLKEDLKIWIYSGDVDDNVPITGTLAWINKLKDQNLLTVKEPMRAWYIPGNVQNELQVGGMVYNLEKIVFLSVRGAGHEVPFWKPQSASVMLDSFLKNQLPPDNPQKTI